MCFTDAKWRLEGSKGFQQATGLRSHTRRKKKTPAPWLLDQHCFQRTMEPLCSESPLRSRTVQFKKYKEYVYCSIRNTAWIWKTYQQCDKVRRKTVLLLFLEMAPLPSHLVLTKLLLLKICICRSWAKINDFGFYGHLTFLGALGKFYSILHNKSLLSIIAEVARALSTILQPSLFS